MMPNTLQEAIIYFSDFENCQQAIIKLRWPDGKVRCPYCQSEDVKFLPNARVWKCYVKHQRAKFSLKVGTIFEDSPLGLDKWFCAMWLVANCKNGVSSYEIHRALKVTQKTAWFIDHRIRLAMQGGSFEKTAGAFEVDESLSVAPPDSCTKTKRPRSRAQAEPVKQS
jgi:transposase-like protein